MDSVLPGWLSVSPASGGADNEARLPALPVQLRDASTAMPFARGSSVGTQAARAARLNVPAITVEPAAMGFHQ